MAAFLDVARGVEAPALVHAHTGQIIARTVEIADTRAARRRGLLGRDGLPPDTALIITLCKGVHTFRMRFAIDVVFVDGSGTVRKIVRHMTPGRMAFSPMASMAIECASGALPTDGLRVGDRLYLAPAPSAAGRGVDGESHERGAQMRRGIVSELQH
jgi:hypothetical protein